MWPTDNDSGWTEAESATRQQNKEIQGMRAIAVLAVLLVHLDAEWIPGGFVGVDVFFVISGYLITSLLANEIRQTNSVDLPRFYKKRIRRLLPAMLATVVVTYFIGFLIFDDEKFNQLVESTLASLLSVSNLYFWSQVGYFDIEASAKPLLHTWSLGTEEQFYLIWPVVLIMGYRLKREFLCIALIISLGVASFLLNFLFIDVEVGAGLVDGTSFKEGLLDGTSTAFYLMPFRIFEFAIGALLPICRLERLTLGENISDTVFTASTVVLGYLLFNLSGESIFPYFNALWVALSAAILIATGSKSRLGRLTLGSTPLVYIGGISYSLYLVHWPLIVFYKAIWGSITPWSMVWIVLTTFCFAALQKKYVEDKFRHPNPKRSTTENPGNFSVLPIMSVLFAAFCIVLLASKWDGRIPAERKVLTNKQWREIREERFCGDTLGGFPRGLFRCALSRNADHTVVVWGDSHALHLVAGLAHIFHLQTSPYPIETVA